MVRALLLTAVSMVVGMTVFEVLKVYLHPDITLAESDVLTVTFSTVIATVAVYFVRRRLVVRNQQLAAALQAKQIVEVENARAIVELRQALADVKQLRGLLPICAHCKKIRNDSGYWSTVETYISAHSEAEFTHSICPDCLEKYYPDYVEAETAA